MRKLLKFIPIPLTIFLALGILFAKNFSLSIDALSIILFLLIFILKILQFLSKKQLNLRYAFGVNAFLLVFVIGAFCYQLQHSKKLDFAIGSNVNAVVQIEKTLKQSNYYQKYVANILQIDSTQVNAKILLNISKDSSSIAYFKDDVLLVNGNFAKLEKPKNPHGFDYANYLQNKQIYTQLLIYNSFHVRWLENRQSFFGAIAKLREKIIEKLQSSGFEKNELAIVNALLLGEKNLISKDLRDDYANAGAIHILAVSGLHIGILLFIFSFLLKIFERFKYGKYLVPVFLIVLLWLYAALAGLSPSVVRAVAMFTALTLGIYVNRLTNTYNTLVISMFFLLLFNPSYLFEVGFQLSYLAVFFILWIYPLLSKYWRPKLKIIAFFWDLFLVSICAQIGVAALSIFYFHQFPMLFIVSNLVILPFLGLILGLGVIVIVLSLSNLLPSFLAVVYQYIIKFLNDFVAIISEQENYVIKEINISIVVLTLIYCSIFLFFKWLENKNYQRLLLFLVAVIAVLTINLFDNLQNDSKNELIVFHQSKNTLIGLKNGRNLSLFSKKNLDSIPNFIKDYQVKTNIKKIIKNHKINNLISINDFQILTIDTLGYFESELVQPDIILLKDTPKINLERILQNHRPKMVIADGSNYKFLNELWSKTCDQYQVTFQSTFKKGAVIMNLNDY